METEEQGLERCFCFIDDQRICNASCMAYLTFPKEGPELNEQQGHCSLLLFGERASRHLTVLAKIMSEYTNTAKKAEADRKRAAANPVVPTTSPFPGKAQ